MQHGPRRRPEVIWPAREAASAEERDIGAARGTGGFRKVGDRYDGYTVVDADGEKIGTVDTTYVDETTQREYVAV